ncbi:MAG: hypothetical protein HQL67_03925 [Magnetococcales bacterium]|nr:hypothetical protein [Magnetococcales bacterium]
MSHRRLFLQISLLLIVMLSLGGIVYYKTANLDDYRPQLIAFISRVTGHPVALKQISYAPLNGLFTLELSKFEILAQDPSEPPTIQVPETLLSFSPLSLFSSRPQLTAIKLINPQINLVLRNHAPLIERAQDTALAGDAKLHKELGLGLKDLKIGRISIQNGILAILDWDHEEGRTWVIDHLQVGIHALSPTRASPVTASARYRSIPFTVNGQIGPLPGTLDPFEMPILLSLEAKSAGLNDMEEALSTPTIKVSTSRGYFTTLLHGSLGKGLQIGSWLQLDEVNLSRIESGKSEQDESPIKQTILERLSKKNEEKNLNIALRQKSTIHMGWGGFPTLEFEEFFIYLDGSPILKTSGWIRDQWRGPLELNVTLLNSVNLDRFPWPEQFPLKGVSPSGSVHLSGIWPTTISYDADLDLTQTTIVHQQLSKKSKVPLSLTFLAAQNNEKIVINNLKLYHPIIPDQNIQVQGPLTPNLQLKTTISWNTEQLVDYFPWLSPWKISGLARISLDIDKPDEKSNWKIDGTIQANNGKYESYEFQKLAIPFHLEQNRLSLPHSELTLAGGRAELLALADLSLDASIPFEVRLAMVGTDLSQLPGLPDKENEIKLEGILFAQTSLQGELDKSDLQQIQNLSGQAHLHIEPGRLAGIDSNAFDDTPNGEALISNPKKSLYWNSLEMDWALINERIILEKIMVDSIGTQISGNGSWELMGNRLFELNIQTDGDLEKGFKKQYAVRIEGDEISNGFRMQNRTVQPE